MFEKRLRFFRSLLFVVDLAVVALCWIAAYFWRFFAPLFPVTKGVPDLDLYLTLLFLVLAVFAVALPASGIYRRPWARPAQVWWPALRASATGVIMAVTLTYFLRPYDFSRMVFAQFFALIFVALILARPLMQAAMRRFYNERAGEGVLIIGAEELGRQVAANIQKHPELGLRVVGFLSRRPEMIGKQIDGLSVLGGYQAIKGILAGGSVHMLIIALPLAAHDRINEVLEQVADEAVDVKIVPDLYRFMKLRGSVEEFEGMPVIGLAGSPLEGWSRLVKRAVDIVGSLAGIVLLGPLMLAAAIGVRLSSPGPIFYRQERMGMDGRLFSMLKFRSMPVGAEDECGPVWACEDDCRPTRFGAFMRKYSIDETPQFFNVLRGEMSLVGPRPERPELIAEFRKQIPGYMLRHRTKAGITGWAQVNGWRGNTSLEKRIEHDLYYIENWSPWFDFQIMLRTVGRVLFDPNAY
ncbi:Undecaprenyl-phosphate glucose phosphotransferase [Desulfarculus baarsii DSM 2075]|uniref:Undecaprenyl-phosphate glucose phosphotransferase n=1 Tax=Desulfarculus baarsii (strain ATCC 33931 / DSM 2075 / LMG 7858 / VKM B-1802 / 2st14) TaxID=644282 RepID=E1QE42_DESB2|nr:undecaprenyl-phosphate glucose phosphotransferase [Desulfarculus baarsii]ADK83828.1 Undecaprenyl-phosphate glucose phosphotransferase [Desulfarculus baarsii DSM 2075]